MNRPNVFILVLISLVLGWAGCASDPRLAPPPSESETTVGHETTTGQQMIDKARDADFERRDRIE